MGKSTVDLFDSQHVVDRRSSLMVYENDDGTYHLLEVGDSGGSVVIQVVKDKAFADFLAAVVNDFLEG